MENQLPWPPLSESVVRNVAVGLMSAFLASVCVNSLDAQQDGAKSGRPCVAVPGRVAQAFAGELAAGELFEQQAGPFILRLSPDDSLDFEKPAGWHIRVYEQGRDDDLSQFTTPYSGPNARDLFLWFDDAGQLLNAPGPERDFYFSPEVGRTIVWEDDSAKRRANTERIKAYGIGTLDVLAYRVAPLKRVGAGRVAAFLWLKFSACLTWPASQ